MFVLYAHKNKLTVRQREPVTSGSVNVNQVRFEFSEDWDGMERIAVFEAGRKSVPVLLDASNECVIPWGVLWTPKIKLFCGVYGTQDGAVVLPTVWADLGWILTGTDVPIGAYPPTPELWKQELAQKGDTLGYTVDGDLGLYSGDRLLSAVPVQSGEGGEGGALAYKFGHGLKQDGINISVDTVDDFSGDNTLPMTAAGVRTTVGNIEALLGTI